MVKMIPIDMLIAHPGSAGRMPGRLFERLVGHVRESGRCPAVIVRGHPTAGDHYQVIDGHARVRVLRRLGRTHVPCDVWEADDRQAMILLLTLNRLRGADDPQARGRLLEAIVDDLGPEATCRLVPDQPARIRRLIDLAGPAPAPRRPMPVGDMPHAMTFFLTADQKSRLLSRLRRVGGDHGSALVKILDLDAKKADSRRRRTSRKAK